MSRAIKTAMQERKKNISFFNESATTSPVSISRSYETTRFNPVLNLKTRLQRRFEVKIKEHMDYYARLSGSLSTAFADRLRFELRNIKEKLCSEHELEYPPLTGKDLHILSSLPADQSKLEEYKDCYILLATWERRASGFGLKVMTFESFSLFYVSDNADVNNMQQSSVPISRVKISILGKFLEARVCINPAKMNSHTLTLKNIESYILDCSGPDLSKYYHSRWYARNRDYLVLLQTPLESLLVEYFDKCIGNYFRCKLKELDTPTTAANPNDLLVSHFIRFNMDFESWYFVFTGKKLPISEGLMRTVLLEEVNKEIDVIMRSKFFLLLVEESSSDNAKHEIRQLFDKSLYIWLSWQEKLSSPDYPSSTADQLYDEFIRTLFRKVELYLDDRIQSHFRYLRKMMDTSEASSFPICVEFKNLFLTIDQSINDLIKNDRFIPIDQQVLLWDLRKIYEVVLSEIKKTFPRIYPIFEGRDRYQDKLLAMMTGKNFIVEQCREFAEQKMKALLSDPSFTTPAIKTLMQSILSGMPARPFADEQIFKSTCMGRLKPYEIQLLQIVHSYTNDNDLIDDQARLQAWHQQFYAMALEKQKTAKNQMTRSVLLPASEQSMLSMRRM